MPTMKRPYLAAALAPTLTGLLAACMSLSCGKAKPPQAPPPQVQVTGVVQQDVPLVHEWVGTVDGFVNADIRPQVTGYVLKQAYREGLPVRRGQLLFQIDPRQFQAAVDQAAANLARDQAALAKATLDTERYTPLAAQKAISQQELDDALSARDQAKATLQADQAALERARLELDWTRVVSPIDGIAGLAKAQVGDLVSGQNVMTTVSTVDPVKVYFNASEAEYMAWAKAVAAQGGGKGMLELVLSDGSTYPHRGEPYLVDRNIDLKTGTITLAGRFPNPDGLLRPGQYAKVRAAMGEEKGALMVPLRSLFEVQGTPQLAVVGADGKVDIRPVATGTHVGPLVAIEKGLKPGERVVVEGVQKVSAGLLVNAIPATH